MYFEFFKLYVFLNSLNYMYIFKLGSIILKK